TRLGSGERVGGGRTPAPDRPRPLRGTAAASGQEERRPRTTGAFRRGRSGPRRFGRRAPRALPQPAHGDRRGGRGRLRRASPSGHRTVPPGPGAGRLARFGGRIVSRGHVLQGRGRVDARARTASGRGTPLLVFARSLGAAGSAAAGRKLAPGRRVGRPFFLSHGRRAARPSPRLPRCVRRAEIAPTTVRSSGFS